MIDIKKVKFGYTHAGKFHADDVFSTALLKILNPDIKIERVYKIGGIGGPVDEDTIIYDIGLGKFDHHQHNAEVRLSGIKYAAFGLLWKEFGKLLVSKDSVTVFDDSFVSVIDNTDNTGDSNPISMVISSFMPLWDEPTNEEVITEAFWRAVEFATRILKREIEKMQSVDRAVIKVTETLNESKDGIVVLKQFMPFGAALIGKAKFVIYPSLRGGYSAQALKKQFGSSELVCPFPEPWRGLRGIDLTSIIPGINFCHNNGFMISAESESAAIDACYAAIKYNDSKNN